MGFSYIRPRRDGRRRSFNISLGIAATRKIPEWCAEALAQVSHECCVNNKP